MEPFSLTRRFGTGSRTRRSEAAVAFTTLLLLDRLAGVVDRASPAKDLRVRRGLDTKLGLVIAILDVILWMRISKECSQSGCGEMGRVVGRYGKEIVLLSGGDVTGQAWRSS